MAMARAAVNRWCRRGAALLAALGVLAAGGAGATPSVIEQVESAGQSQGPQPVEAVRLLAGTTGVGERASVPLGLEVELAEGWKAYWRNPGAAGLPPRVDWSGSTNLAEAKLAYPAPTPFKLFGMQTYGYGDRVVFPIEARLGEAGQALQAQAKVELLVCRKVCVPVTREVSATVPAGPAEPSQAAAKLARWQGQVPVTGEAAGLRVAGAVAGTLDGGPAVAVTLASESAFNDPEAILTGLDPGGFGPPRLQVRGDGKGLVALFRPNRRAADKPRLAGRDLRITVLDGARTAELTVTPESGDKRLAELAAALPAAGSGGSGSSGGPGAVAGGGPSPGAAGWAAMLGLAVLGGLILNVMPCVLPVLSLKVLAVVDSGGRAPGRVRVNFLVTAAGILTAFLVLAGALAGLKLAGQSVGWGIQFQQPVFLAFMATVVAAFALNLWGVFEIPLPARLGSALAATADRHGDSIAGHFLSGAFATLLATPCSAPFLGTAVSFALARGPASILAIFAALGLGLALPYLLVAAVPAAAARLPRPGRWMGWVKRGLGVLLAGTAIWLLSVLAAQRGVAVAGFVGAALVGGAVLLALARVPRPLARGLGGAGAVAAVAAALLAPLAGSAPTEGEAKAAAPSGYWQNFARERIEAAVARDKVVFVDITADWCITCKANKRLVLSDPAVAQRLASDKVVALRGDWTSPDPEIDSYLADNGRYGVPFNAVYGPGAPEGIVLPEVLSKQAVTRALAKARPGPGT